MSKETAAMLSIPRSQEEGQITTWISLKKYAYLISLVLPLAPISSCYLAVTTGNGLGLWATIVFWYFGIALLDKYFGDDEANPTDKMVEELKSEEYYKKVMYLTVPLLWAGVIACAYTVSQYEWSWFSFLGGALSAGLVAGIGVNLGHEMGHKINDRVQVFFAKMALALSGYGHFFIEHNKGHHKDVATPEDPASSRMGESLYKFVKREIPGAFRRAWELESARLKRMGKSEWSFSNEIIQPAIATIALYSLLLAYFGPIMIPFLLIVAGFGYWQLTCANYIEHYGLLRQKNEKTGRYERCQPHHSWNANQKVSNLILLHLQRHSDHHAHPTRAYQVLRDYNGVPNLPAGYPLMFVYAMIPSVWFSIMDPKVVAWAGGDMDKVNIDADKKDELYSRYHNPEKKAA